MRYFAIALCIFVCSLVGIPAPAQHAELGAVPSSATRYTGAVDLLIVGETPLKGGDEILKMGEQTKFRGAGAKVVKYAKGSIEYVPTEAGPDGIRRALTTGLLLHKMTITGAPPGGIRLAAGTYYAFLQFVRGRWIVSVVDGGGHARCLTYGAIVRELYIAHPGPGHVKAPHIVTHQFLSAAEATNLMPGGLGVEGWTETIISWEALGAGCWSQVVCVPST